MTTSSDLPSDPWTDLTFTDLQQWAGARTLQRGRTYQKDGSVRSLARGEDGCLSAEVQGGDLYFTIARRDSSGKLSSQCTCPVGYGCKHAVAVVLEYLECVKAGKPVPTETEDSRVKRLARARFGWAGGSPASPSEAVDLGEYLAGLSADDLVELVLELADSHDDIRQLLQGRAELACGEVEVVARTVRDALAEASSEPGYRNHWDDDGYTADYSVVTKHLENLLAAGHADLVVELGLEVFQAGNEQVGMSDDDGETAMSVAEALEPVWEALAQCSLTPAQRILWIYDRYREDEYSILDSVEEPAIWEVEPAVWGEVADTLLQRLADPELAHVQGQGNWSRRYARERLAGWAIGALEAAERKDEALALAVSEARFAGSYDRAVKLLIEARKLDEAQALALEGIKQSTVEFPGIAAQLRTHLRDLAALAGDDTRVAAFLAEEFFDQPSLDGYRKLRDAASKLGAWEQVRAMTLSALEKGTCPLGSKGWPLPQAGTAPNPARQGGRQLSYHLLTEIALDERDHDAALKWYAKTPPSGYGWGDYLGAQVARGVATTHPDEAVTIWKRLAEREIDKANRGGYEASLRHLRPIQRLLTKLGREPEWKEYLVALREQNRRRRALLETLDTLQEGPIIES